MDSEGSPQKKESWFSRISQKLAQIKDSMKKTEPETAPQVKIVFKPETPDKSKEKSKKSDPERDQRILAQQLNLLKKILRENGIQTEDVAPPKKSEPKVDPFDINEIEKGYHGLNITSPPLKKTKKAEESSAELGAPESTQQIRKEFIADLARLKKLIKEKTEESIAPEQKAAMKEMKESLMNELHQLQEMLEENATPEERKAMNATD
jgi:hypothetical protein